MEDSLLAFLECEINDEDNCDFIDDETYSIELSKEDWMKVLKQFKRKSLIEFIAEKIYDFDFKIETSIDGNYFYIGLKGNLDDETAKVLRYFLEKYRSNGNSYVDILKSDINEYFDKVIYLNKFEYDLLYTNDQNHKRSFKSFATYRNMKKKGHFRYVTDEDMTIEEILKYAYVVGE